MIKRAVEKIPGVRNIKKKIIFDTQYRYDKKFFMDNFSHSSENQKKIGYNMLLISHSLEKGMSNKKPRRFGVEKVEKLMELIGKYVSYGNYEDQYDFICAINALRGYLKFYEGNKWIDADEYKKVVKFLIDHKNVKKMNVGSYKLCRKDFENDSKIDYEKFLASRHSVREYLKKSLSEKDINRAVEVAILSPSACNRQMCKVYYVKNQKKADKLISLAQGFGGFEKDTISLLVVTFDVSANYMVGERNQGWLNAGLFSMNLVNALHSIGIGSCFCQFGNSAKDEEKVKKILGTSASERVAIFIAAGYYCDEMLIPYSPRKGVSDILRIE